MFAKLKFLFSLVLWFLPIFLCQENAGDTMVQPTTSKSASNYIATSAANAHSQYDNVTEAADFDYSKYLVAIKDAKNDDLICSGLIIRPNIILTAAHCLYKIK